MAETTGSVTPAKAGGVKPDRQSRARHEPVFDFDTVIFTAALEQHSERAPLPR